MEKVAPLVELNPMVNTINVSGDHRDDQWRRGPQRGVHRQRRRHDLRLRVRPRRTSYQSIIHPSYVFSDQLSMI